MLRIISVVSTFILWSLSLNVAAQLPGPLIETDWLAKNQDKVVILDVRKDVKSFTRKPV